MMYNIQYMKTMQLTNDKLRLISRGSNSQIYLYGQSSKVVLKVVSTSCSKEVKHLANQQTLLGKLNHHGIIRSLKYKEGISLNGICRNVLVLEYAKHGSLLDFLKKRQLNVPQIRHLFHSLCQTIQYLHCNYFVHRDLKLENVLVGEQSFVAKIKLSDFGFASTYYENEKIKMFNTFKGTRRGYMAPEIHQILQNPNKQYDGCKSDIFALGVILFAMMLGKLPFEFANKQNKIFKQVQDKQFDLFWNNHINSLTRIQLQDHAMVDDFKSLFQSMVCYNPQQRYNIKQVLSHPWLKGQQTPIKFN